VVMGFDKTSELQYSGDATQRMVYQQPITSHEHDIPATTMSMHSEVLEFTMPLEPTSGM
jgi:hypothetical protein